jgi:ATP-binding cassette subfamily B protein
MMDMYLDKIFKKKFNFIKAFLDTFKIGFMVAPAHFLLFICLDILNSSLSASVTFFTAKFFSSVTNNKGNLNSVIMALVVLCIVIVMNHVVNGIGHSVIPALKFKMDRDAMLKLNRKMQELPTVWFENQEFLNYVEKAYRGTEYSFAVLVPMMRFLFNYGPYCVIMGVYLYRVDPILSLCIVALFIPNFLSTALRPSKLFSLEDNAAPVRRASEHYRQCITEPEYYKETRTLGIYNYFKKKYSESTDLLNSLIWKAQFKVKALEFGVAFTSLCGFGGVMYLLVNSLLKGHITVAMFAAVFATIGNMYALCDDAAGHFLAPFDGMATVKNFLSLIYADLPKKEDKAIAFTEGITFDNVSFSYIGSEKKALDGISLDIKAGETIAIVGINGSGKTTLSRLLLGLYTPTEGMVKVGGIDTREVNRKSVTRGMSAVFQKFQKYKMTLAENIQLGDYGLKENKDILNLSIKHADIAVTEDKFPMGLDTMLSRDFDGIELSGGQWQRVAIARGLYRIRDIIVLDEPTAAIDPIEESRLYEKFAEISKDKTAVLITHRIGSARIADRIVVMKEGKIAEIGSHEELISQNGLYKEMFDAQIKWYQ